MDGVDTIARAFVDARGRAASPIAYPGARPESLSGAYAVQDRAIALKGERVIGWKVGKIPPPWDARLGVNRLAGPIFTALADAREPEMPVFADGFAAAEAEFLIRIGRAPEPGARGLSLEAAAELVDAVHVGIEIASSPYPNINADGPLVTISDFGNNHGMLIDAAIEDWRSLDFIDWPIVSRVNGEVVGEASARTMLDGPIGAVAFLVDCLADRGMTLEPGQWVSSGAVTGVHPVAVGDRYEADFAGRVVRCTIGAATGTKDTMRAEVRDGDAAA